MLTYIIIAGLLFSTAMLFMGWRDNYGYEDALVVVIAALACSLLWPITILCAALWVAGKNLLEAGRALRRLWEEGREP